MKYQEFVAEKDFPKLYYCLKSYGLAESYISKLRRDPSFLQINGQKADMRSKVNHGDNVEFALNVGKKSEFKTCEIDLKIVYEDEYVLVIDKPALLPSIPTKSHYDFNLAGAVCNYMKTQTDNFVYRIINRLDKDTSGLVVIAKNLLFYNKIGKIEKTYEALCKGKIDHKMEINKPILTLTENGINAHKRIISPLGKEATTFVTPIISNEKISHIRLTLLHGRTHQIRVHLSSINHALLGDQVYGSDKTLSHTALICKEISFVHPITQETLYFSASYPEDFANILKQIST